MATDQFLKLSLTDQKCKERGWGGFGGVCGAFLLRLSLSPDAKNELIRRGHVAPADEDVCLNPLSGCALKVTPRFASIQALIFPR